MDIATVLVYCRKDLDLLNSLYMVPLINVDSVSSDVKGPFRSSRLLTQMSQRKGQLLGYGNLER
jgi:hypothetical protein